MGPQRAAPACLLLTCLMACIALSVPPPRGGLSQALIANEDPRPKVPLDLPASGAGFEDEPEPVPQEILFFDQYFEGDAFVWVIDKSGSMAGERLALLKFELGRAIEQLSRRSELGLVAFSSNTVAWRDHPVVADSVNKHRAVAWIDAIEPGGITMVGPAGVKALEIVQQSQQPDRRLIVVSDGEPQDAGNALVNIGSANYGAVPIDTMLVSESDAGRPFMQALAAQNGGSFTWRLP